MVTFNEHEENLIWDISGGVIASKARTGESAVTSEGEDSIATGKIRATGRKVRVRDWEMGAVSRGGGVEGKGSGA